MLPILEFGDVHLRTYVVIQVMGITLGAMFSFHRLLRLQVAYPTAVIVRGLVLVIVAGAGGAFAGAQLIATLQQLLRPDLAVDWAGNSILGVVAGGVLAAVLYCRAYGAPPGRPFDLGVLPLPLSQAIGRLACQAAGCCYGRPTDSWAGLYLPDHAGVWQVRYPTQLMSVAVNLGIFGVLVAVERYGMRRLGWRRGAPPPARGWPFDGFLFLLYIVLYGSKRFGMEFLRADALPPLLGPLNLVQVLCAGVALAAGGLIAWQVRRNDPGQEIHS
jgi:phosphatidylglycerol:prolipoprotein diacylglycerol transferase